LALQLRKSCTKPTHQLSLSPSPTSPSFLSFLSSSFLFLSLSFSFFSLLSSFSWSSKTHQQHRKKARLRHLKTGGNARHGLVGPRWGYTRHRPKYPATHLPPAGLPEAYAEVFCLNCQRYKHASVLERPPQGYGHRQKLAEGTSPRGLTCHCTDKAGYIYSSSLQIRRVVLLLLRQRCGAGLSELQRARGRSKY